MRTHRVGWKVSLSNGETFFEGKGRFDEEDKPTSAWNILQEYIKENSLKITSLSLFTDDGRNFHLPSAGSNPRFSAFSENSKPNDYKMFRATSFTLLKGSQLFTVAQAEYDGFVLQFWVSEDNPDNCWVLCLPVEEL